MSPRFWSFALQWSRVGINAGLFLIAARFLTLAEIGAFATAYAPIRLTQGLHKAGIGESVIILTPRQLRQDALFALSLGSGIALTLCCAAIGFALNAALLIGLSAIPLLHSISAVSEGILRQRLHLRALALRTMVSQSIAGALALWMLSKGLGPWALVAFALSHATINTTLSCHLAAWRPKSRPNWQYQRLIGVLVIEISSRDLLSTALFPLMQLVTALAFGLPAAGPFQIATRILSLIEALSLSPLRFLALPQLRRLPAAERAAALPEHLRLTATLSLWVWSVTLLTAPDILPLLIGTAPAEAATPILIALTGFGLLSALLMPINQALIAAGHTRLMLHRAALLVTLTCVFAPFAPSPAALAASISLAALLTTLWHLSRALPRLGLSLATLSSLAPPLCTVAAIAALFTLLPPLPVPAQLTLGSALYGAFLLIPYRRIVT
ncbi:oligosaccharide flippase family protein (plasmid) [Sulfitobacter sp. W027]|uniref:oligosaccharide flippase family protein n=1 Tax=Sulfitobacter sp. W027 TaxID=2867025 RepID=UPI0021A6705D|nr:oligosaccharide flippase family protein [Sulfitobacter sp. W027]UWR35701.1 oligosaccharide flippase family protein [Sulfitobacter sp. W027]